MSGIDKTYIDKTDSDNENSLYYVSPCSESSDDNNAIDNDIEEELLKTNNNPFDLPKYEEYDSNINLSNSVNSLNNITNADSKHYIELINDNDYSDFSDSDMDMSPPFKNSNYRMSEGFGEGKPNVSKNINISMSEHDNSKNLRMDSDDINIGINGFGRIGRLICRLLCSDNEYNCGVNTCKIVAINDTKKPEYLAYLFKYDSVHGKFKGPVSWDDSSITINGTRIMVSSCREPKLIPWGEMGADFVCECTGRFKTTESANDHISGGGAKFVVMSCPASDDTPTFVCGVNTKDYKGEHIVSNASCTTNCLAPLVSVVNKFYEIEHAMVTTIHAITASQNTVDGSVSSGSRDKKKNWRSGRGAMDNIIPTKTGAGVAINKVISGLDGKITAMAFRVPTSNVSVVDMTCRVKKSTSLDRIMDAIEKESISCMSGLRGVIKLSTDELVSSDFNGEICSCVVDKTASMQLNDNVFKLVAWYDNEWSYSCRMIDLVIHMAKYQSNTLNKFGNSFDKDKKRSVRFSV